MRRTPGWRVSVGVLAFVLATVALGLSGSRSATAQTTNVSAFMTLYGWADNSPPGPGIAHGCLHGTAGGTGTFADPITFATDVSELGWCQVIYVPYMQRYFIHEDECSECDRDWNTLHLYRFDMWAGGDVLSTHQPERRALLRCESTWTRANTVTDPNNPSIVVDPPPGLPVTTAPVFSPTSGCWSGPVAITNPGRQVGVVGVPVQLRVQAVDSDVGQTMSYRAVGLPAGLSIDAGSGLVSGVPSSRTRRTVTVMVADATNSSAVTFIWLIRRH